MNPLQEVSCGRRHWQELEQYGFEIKRLKHCWRIGPRQPYVYKLMEHDFITASKELSASDLRELASFILACDAIDLPEDEKLLNTIWDAAFDLSK